MCSPQIMNKFVSLLLVIFPILNIYCLPGSSWPISYILTILVFMYSLSRKGKLNFKLPCGFKSYWIYISIIYILFAHNFGLGLFIPGGYSFFMWIIFFWLCNNFLDYSEFKKYYRIIFIGCSVAFLFQEFCYYTNGVRPLFMLPLPFYGVDKLEIITNQMLLDRSSCFFIEPSHFAQFTIPLLAIEIFDNSKNKIINYFSVYIILILLLLQSGNGLVGVLVLLTIRMLTYFRQSKGRYKYLSYLAFIPIALFCVYKYLETEIGNGIMERVSGMGLSEDAEGATRIIKGFLLYLEIPSVNKIFGYHIDAIEDFATSSRLSYLFVSKISGEYELYLNGFQHVLIINGIIGMTLFMRVWLGLFVCNNLLSKSLVIIFIILLFISNQYIGQMMLICMLLPYMYKNNRL